ncbi:MAG: helix-turn-helix domain-containing protein [Bacilli bacterium]|nr:helix-turn-helix domain-containing protein [Bacilli bacterium]
MYENVEEIEKLNEKQENTINMLVLGKSVEEVAKELNLNINTIYRWKKSQKFKQALKVKQDTIFDEITSKLGIISIDALNVLYDLMNNATNENNKLKASMFILDKILQCQQLDILKRIDALEERLNDE